jgi:biotin carboxyl carrier protein
MNKNTSLTAEIEGQRFELTSAEWEELDCIQVDENTYHLIEDGKTYAITVIEANDSSKKITISIDGENKSVILLNDLDLLIERMGLTVASSKKLLVLNAPMPGLVTSIKVEEGQEVEEGSPILILEAMKMENVISAPHHTRIKEINVEVGQAIEKGTALVEFSDV